MIIFMYLHTAARLTGSNSTSGLALVSWWSIPVSVATSTCLAVVSRGGVDHPAGGQDLRAGLGHDAGADEVQRARGAAALRVDEQFRVRILRHPSP